MDNQVVEVQSTNNLTQQIVTQQPAVVNNEVATVTTQQVVEAILPEGVYDLSSGARVRITQINSAIAQDLMIKIFKGTNLDGTGAILEGGNTGEQIAAAGKIMEYHDALISLSVELISSLPKDEDWLDRHMIAYANDPVFAKLDPYNKPMHKQHIYLRYYAFQNEADWALLSDKAIPRS